MATALVTGATGFLGRHVVRELQSHGWKVHEASRTRRITLGSPQRLFAPLLASVRPEVVVHLAGLASGDGVDVSRSNVLGTWEVLEASASTMPHPRVVVMTSAAVYASSDEPVGEDAPVVPSSLYGWTKAFVHTASRSFAAGGLPVVEARAFNLAGPGMRRGLLLADLCAQIAMMETGRQPPRLAVGPLHPRRDFVDARDAAVALRLMIERGRPGEVYHVCSGAGRSVAEVVEALKRRSRVSFALDVDPKIPAGPSCSIGSPAKIERELGWHPARLFDRTLDDTLDDWRRRVQERSP